MNESENKPTDKSVKMIQWGPEQSFWKIFLEQLDIPMKGYEGWMKSDSYLTPYTKTNSKWITGFIFKKKNKL